MSSAVMYERLRELSDAGLVIKSPAGAYELSGIGRELGRAIEPLSQWSDRWAAHDRPH